MFTATYPATPSRLFATANMILPGIFARRPIVRFAAYTDVASLGARVRVAIHIEQMRCVDRGVDLRRSQAGVAEQLLQTA